MLWTLLIKMKRKAERIRSKSHRCRRFVDFWFIADIFLIYCGHFLCCTSDGKLHGAVQVTQVTLATLDNLVSGWRGLASQCALLVHLKAAFLIHRGAGIDCQGWETLMAPAAIPRYTRDALAHTLMLVFDQGLYFSFCKRFWKKISL